jgi:hypothetical protein
MKLMIFKKLPPTQRENNILKVDNLQPAHFAETIVIQGSTDIARTGDQIEDLMLF